MTNIVNTLLDLPENDDSMDCECDNGIDRDQNACYYCNGTGVVSEREYKHLKELEQQEFNVNN